MKKKLDFQFWESTESASLQELYLHSFWLVIFRVALVNLLILLFNLVCMCMSTPRESLQFFFFNLEMLFELIIFRFLVGQFQYRVHKFGWSVSVCGECGLLVVKFYAISRFITLLPRDVCWTELEVWKYYFLTIFLVHHYTIVCGKPVSTSQNAINCEVSG